MRAQIPFLAVLTSVLPLLASVTPDPVLSVFLLPFRTAHWWESILQARFGSEDLEEAILAARDIYDGLTAGQLERRDIHTSELSAREILLDTLAPLLQKRGLPSGSCKEKAVTFNGLIHWPPDHECVGQWMGEIVSLCLRCSKVHPSEEACQEHSKKDHPDKEGNYLNMVTSMADGTFRCAGCQGRFPTRDIALQPHAGEGHADIPEGRPVEPNHPIITIPLPKKFPKPRVIL